VVTICSASVALLIAVGVAGAGAALTGRPWLLSTIRVLGSALLFGYAGLAARRALRPPVITDGEAGIDVGGGRRRLPDVHVA